MRQLLAGLGMKQADVDRIMATADANSKKQIVNSASSFFASLPPYVAVGFQLWKRFSICEKPYVISTPVIAMITMPTNTRDV